MRAFGQHILFGAVLLLALSVGHAQTGQKYTLRALGFLLGRWFDTGSLGASQKVEFHPTPDGALAGRRWIGELGTGEYIAKEAIFIRYDRASNWVVADQRMAGGQHIHYRLASVSSASVQFVSESAGIVQIYRLTYRRIQPLALEVRLESAPAARPDAFSTVSISHLHTDLLIKPLDGM